MRKSHCRLHPISTALLCSAAILALSSCTETRPINPAADPVRSQMAKRFKFTKKQTLQVDYLLFLPANYDARSRQRWPLILFLHGAGERGSDVWKVATHGPPKNVTDHPDFPFILVSPRCPEGQTWSKDVLLVLLDEITRTYRVDTNRVYLTGLSMGGYGTWD